MVQQQQTAGGGQTVIRQQLAAGQQQLPSVAAGAAAAGGQRVVINQPGLRPGQPGSQITVPLSTLQVGHADTTYKYKIGFTNVSKILNLNIL